MFNIYKHNDASECAWCGGLILHVEDKRPVKVSSGYAVMADMERFVWVHKDTGEVLCSNGIACATPVETKETKQTKEHV